MFKYERSTKTSQGKTMIADLERVLEADTIIVNRRLPVNIVSEDLPYFNPDLAKEISRPRIREFEDVKISAEGILFKNNRIMSESFSNIKSFEQWKMRSRLKNYVQNILVRRSSIKNRAVWVTDDWSEGYFHWIGDALPKLIIAKDLLKEVPLLLPTKYRKLGFVTDSLKILGIGNAEFINENETVIVRKLLLPFHTDRSDDFHEDVIDEIRKTLLGSYAHNGPVSRRIYISRRRANRRRILNEDELSAILAKHDFETVISEDLSFAEEIRLFSSVRHLVSLHGAGLTNMIFMPAGGSVLELRHNDDRVTNAFFNLASALGLDYFYQLCEADVPGEGPNTADVTVDPQTFAANLERFLKDI